MKKTDYYKNLPKKRMASGVLFFNSKREILLVQPTYKENWEIPGGVIELNESPRDAAIRGVREELGLQLTSPLKLLCVEYMSGISEKSEALFFIFLGEMLSEYQVSKIRLRTDELRAFRYFPIEEAISLLGAVLGRRIAKCAEAKECFYSEGSYDSGFLKGQADS